MNAKNLRTLAHELRADPENYNQREWMCGTVACIGGRASLLAYQEGTKGGTRPRDPFQTPREWLDLTYEQTERLFCADPSEDDTWPFPYGERYLYALQGQTNEAPAYVAADLLDALADGTVTL